MDTPRSSLPPSEDHGIRLRRDSVEFRSVVMRCTITRWMTWILHHVQKFPHAVTVVDAFALSACEVELARSGKILARDPLILPRATQLAICYHDFAVLETHACSCTRRSHSISPSISWYKMAALMGVFLQHRRGKGEAPMDRVW